MTRSRLLVTFASTLLCALATLSFGQDSDDGFKSIFNGKDLTGWSGDPNLWSVENGAIVGQTNDTDKKITQNQALSYTEDQEIGDFSIRFDYKISNWGNSGLYYRGWYLDPEKRRMRTRGARAAETALPAKGSSCSILYIIWGFLSIEPALCGLTLSEKYIILS